jgi:ubiquitin-conjugating enzyme E2 T
MTKARLTRELSRLFTDPPPGIAAYTPNPADMTIIRAQITGPEDSPFEKGVFLLLVNISGRYPFEPPRCRFVTPVFHPNIDSGGRICLDTLKSPPGGSWSPAVSLPSLLLSIRSLLASPNPDDGLVPEISELYKRNPKKWEEEARSRTEKEATVGKLEEVERGLDGDNFQKSNENQDTETNNETKNAANDNEPEEADNEEKKDDDNRTNKRSTEVNKEGHSAIDAKRTKR